MSSLTFYLVFVHWGSGSQPYRTLNSFVSVASLSLLSLAVYGCISALTFQTENSKPLVKFLTLTQIFLVTSILKWLDDWYYCMSLTPMIQWVLVGDNTLRTISGIPTQ